MAYTLNRPHKGQLRIDKPFPVSIQASWCRRSKNMTTEDNHFVCGHTDSEKQANEIN